MKKETDLEKAMSDFLIAEKRFRTTWKNYKMNEKKLAKQFRKSREEMGLSLRDMAKILKVSAPYLSDVERGNRRFPVKFLEKITK